MALLAIGLSFAFGPVAHVDWIFRHDEPLLGIRSVLLVAVIVMFWGLALYLAVQWLRYPRVVLEWDENPVPIGEAFRGRIVIDGWKGDVRPFHLDLECIRDEYGNPRYHPITWYRDRQTIEARDIRLEDGTLVVPFSFEIPGDCDPSTVTQVRWQTRWRLQVDVPYWGPNLGAVFSIPVFRPPAPA